MLFFITYFIFYVIINVRDAKTKGKEMNFFEKLGKVLMNNIAYTVILVVALILFLYFAEGDLIAGVLTALSALVIYVCVLLLYQEYKKMPASGRAPVARKSAPKKSAKRK